MWIHKHACVVFLPCVVLNLPCDSLSLSFSLSLSLSWLQCLPVDAPLPPTSAAWSEATKLAEAQLERRFLSLVNSLMAVCDVDGDGALSLSEFCRLDELLRWCGSKPA